VFSVTSTVCRFGMALAVSCISVSLLACASLTREQAAPVLRLAPASLGKSLSAVQHLDIEVAGQVRGVDAMLEVDEAQIRLAVLQWGQTIARLSWDGQTLDESLAPGWPRVVSGAQVLSDLQYVWWPSHAIQAVLPNGWVLHEQPRRRTLLHDGRSVLIIDAVGDGTIDMSHLDTGYRVKIRTQGDQPGFVSP